MFLSIILLITIDHLFQDQLNCKESYRPLSFLRITEAIVAVGDFSPQTHGFRLEHPTVDAIQEVVKAAQIAENPNHWSRRVAFHLTLAVRNTFKAPRYLFERSIRN